MDIGEGHQIEPPETVEHEEHLIALPQVVWLGQYLHERAHWIQLFTTFFGAAELLKHEMQFQYCRSLLADTKATVSFDDLSLLQSKYASPYVQRWMALEAFGALLTGERPIDHFENELVSGELRWLNLARSGCAIFSARARALATGSFKWAESTDTDVGGMELREIAQFRTSDGYVAGASTVAELHAEIAANAKIGNFLEVQTPYSIHPHSEWTGRSSEARRLFYSSSGLKPNWLSEIVCSLIAHSSLSAPVLLFLDTVESEDFNAISPLSKFAWASREVREASACLKRLENVPPYEAFPEIVRQVELRIGEGHHLVVSRLLTKIFSNQDYGQRRFSEPDLSLRFIAHNLSQAGETAIARPFFAICPGHEYVLDRGSFDMNFRKITNILEWHGGKGFGPAPKYAQRFDPDEFFFHLASSFQKELCRLIMIGTEMDISDLVRKYIFSYDDGIISFKDFNFDAITFAINDLDAPKNLRRRFEGILARYR